MNYSNATRLHMTPDEETAQLERLDSHGAAASSTASPQAPTQPSKQSGVFKPHFICECYFMTLNALHLGYIGLSKMQDSINEVWLHILPAPTPPDFPLEVHTTTAYWCQQPLQMLI